MKMPTSFIAVQCFQCSTMQVKQQKKNSNKWTCVVCNEKQSVRKVFAQGFMAKHIRTFVQTFNMSRLNPDNDEETQGEGNNNILLDSPIRDEKDNQKRRRRSDWSEYIDDDQKERCRNSESAQEDDDESEPIIVTEMPKALLPLFKKPKFKETGSEEFGVGVGGGGNNSGKKLLKPVFPNGGNKNAPSKDMKPTGLELSSSSMRNDCNTVKFQETGEPLESRRALKWDGLRSKIQGNNQDKFSKSTESYSYPHQSNKRDEGSVSKWSNYMTLDDNDDECRVSKVPPVKATDVKRTASKWSSFIDEDDDQDDYEVQVRGRRGSAKDSGAFESIINDQRVEDDIHPDFL